MSRKPFQTRFKNLITTVDPSIRLQYETLEKLPTAEEKAYYLFHTMKQTPQQISKRLNGVNIESVLDWIKNPQPQTVEA